MLTNLKEYFGIFWNPLESFGIHLVLIPVRIHGNPVLDVSLTPLPPMSMQFGPWSKEFDLPILNKFSGPTLHLGQNRQQKPCNIIHQGSAAPIGAPAILVEDSLSNPQALFKLTHLGDLDYRACHGLQV